MSTAAPTDPAPAPAHDPVAHTLALLRPWIDFVPPQQRRLGLFIGLAVAAHLAVFLFIRIDATRPVFQRETRTHIALEAPAQTEGAAGSEALVDRLSDPRLFLLPILPPPPSFQQGPALETESNLGSDEPPAPATAPPYPLIPAIQPTLAEQVSAALLPPRQPFSYAEAPPAPPPGPDGSWQWDEALAARAPQGLAALPSPVSDTALSPTGLRVAVDASGAVRDVLLDQASQRPDLDQAAILAARKVRFRPLDGADTQWGRLTIFWHPAAPPREEIVPTPPSSSP